MHAHLLTFRDWSSTEAEQLLSDALTLKRRREDYPKLLKGKSIVGLFEKPSLRTRVSFDIGINKLGGHFVYVDSQGEALAKREAPGDIADNLSQWADAIVARVYDHSTLVNMAERSSVPVINALCDQYHPCQALADYITLTEALSEASDNSVANCIQALQGKTLAYIGDGNNVTHSLMILGILLGVNQVIICPQGFEIDTQAQKIGESLAKKHNVSLTFSSQIEDCKKVDAIYTDTWISMGDDTPINEIKAKFMPYQVNRELLKASGATFVMHCQPAHRDLEITGDVMDSSASLLMQQAENRLHAQNAILSYFLNTQTNQHQQDSTEGFTHACG